MNLQFTVLMLFTPKSNDFKAMHFNVWIFNPKLLSCIIISGALLKQIEKDFGSYEKLKLLIAKTSKGVDGNGWGILGYQPYTQKLTVLQCENHEKLTQWGVIPVLVIDVWGAFLLFEIS